MIDEATAQSAGQIDSQPVDSHAAFHQLVTEAARRDAEAYERVDADVRRLLAVRREQRRGRAPTVVFTVRLDRAEVDALEQRAAERRLKPSVLARNLIRSGVFGDAPHELSDAIERVASAVAEVRDLVA